jgi:hypothetical protein
VTLTLNQLSASLTLLSVPHEVASLGGNTVGIGVHTDQTTILLTLADSTESGDTYVIGTSEETPDYWEGEAWDTDALPIAYSVKGYAETHGYTLNGTLIRV